MYFAPDINAGDLRGGQGTRWASHCDCELTMQVEDAIFAAPMDSSSAPALARRDAG
jgi:hypothetical protein